MHLSGRLRIQRDQVALDDQRADPAERLTGPVPVRHVLEEREHAEHLVAPPGGGDVRSPSLPIRFHITSVAPSSQGWLTPRACNVPAIMPVATSEAGWPSSGTHQGACGQPVQGRLDEGRAALGGRDRREPVAGTPDQVLVPGVRLVQDAQGHLGGRGLVSRRAAIRLERVADPAVVVAVGGHRVPYRRAGPSPNSRWNRRRSITRALAATKAAAALKSGVFIGPSQHGRPGY